VHATVLVLHVGAGSVGLLVAPFGLAAPKRRGRHTRLGWIYQAAVACVAATAVGLSVFHWSRLWWLAAIGVATETAALGGLAAERSRFPGWLPWHVSLMLGSYVSLVTALFVVNLGGPVAWILPTVVGSPLIALTARRAATA